MRHGAPDTGGSERQCGGEDLFLSLPGGLDGSDEPTGPPELKGVCVCDLSHTRTLFWTRSEISRDYPLNLSISLSGGKETNQDSPSNGE